MKANATDHDEADLKELMVMETFGRKILEETLHNPFRLRTYDSQLFSESVSRSTQDLADRCARIFFKAALARKSKEIQKLFEAFVMSWARQTQDLGKKQDDVMNVVLFLMLEILRAAIFRLLEQQVQDPDAGSTGVFLFGIAPQLTPQVLLQQEDVIDEQDAEDGQEAMR